MSVPLKLIKEALDGGLMRLVVVTLIGEGTMVDARRNVVDHRTMEELRFQRAFGGADEEDKPQATGCSRGERRPAGVEEEMVFLVLQRGHVTSGGEEGLHRSGHPKDESNTCLHDHRKACIQELTNVLISQKSTKAFDEHQRNYRMSRDTNLLEGSKAAFEFGSLGWIHCSHLLRQRRGSEGVVFRQRSQAQRRN